MTHFHHNSLRLLDVLCSRRYLGCYSCATELALDRPTVRYVDFVMHRLRMLRHHGVHAILVADNEASRMKKATQEARRHKKDAQRATGLRLLEEAEECASHERPGKIAAANAAFQGCISITSKMVNATLQAAHADGFDAMFAPVEADAQLAYLCKTGRAAGVITEDSDLVAYSVLCETPFPILYKMDKFGQATSLALDLAKLHATAQQKGENDGSNSCNDSCSTSGTTTKGTGDAFTTKLSEFGCGLAAKRMFVQMAVLSGCDYVDSLPGVGTKTAQTLLLKHRAVNSDSRLEAIVRAKRAGSKGITVPEGFLDIARQAECSFFYALVLDGDTLRHFTEPVRRLEDGSTIPVAEEKLELGPINWTRDPADLFGAVTRAEEVTSKLAVALAGVQVKQRVQAPTAPPSRKRDVKSLFAAQVAGKAPLQVPSNRTGTVTLDDLDDAVLESCRRPSSDCSSKSSAATPRRPFPTLDTRPRAPHSNASAPARPHEAFRTPFSLPPSEEEHVLERVDTATRAENALLEVSNAANTPDAPIPTGKSNESVWQTYDENYINHAAPAPAQLKGIQCQSCTFVNTVLLARVCAMCGNDLIAENDHGNGGATAEGPMPKKNKGCPVPAAKGFASKKGGSRKKKNAPLVPTKKAGATQDLRSFFCMG